MELNLTGIWQNKDDETKLTFFDLGGDNYRILNFDADKEDVEISVAGFNESLRVKPNVFKSDILFNSENEIQIKGRIYHRLTNRALSNKF